MPHETLQWWHFNVPVDQRTEECPDYLITTSEKDQKSIAVWHSDYVYVSWEEVKYNISKSINSGPSLENHANVLKPSTVSTCFAESQLIFATTANSFIISMVCMAR